MELLIALLVLALLVVVIAALAWGSRRWRAATRELHARLAAARLATGVGTFSETELSGLPAPVQRYFRTALTEGQLMLLAARVEQAGTFNLSETGEKWRPFRAAQRVIVRRPGFDWEARIAMLPGLKVRVHDAYVAGEGLLHASLCGLVPLVKLRGTTDVAHGELMRFLSEAAWYPTALLPSQGVRWETVDDSSARATLKDGETAVMLLFRFDEQGLIESVRAEARGRTVKGAVVPTAWEGRWSEYELHHGMQIPVAGEVAWILPEGPRPYWRGRLTNISYEFA
jgi:hypothetical protein